MHAARVLGSHLLRFCNRRPNCKIAHLALDWLENVSLYESFLLSKCVWEIWKLVGEFILENVWIPVVQGQVKKQSHLLHMETWAMASVGDLGVRRGFVDSVRFFTLRSLDPLTVLNSFFWSLWRVLELQNL